MLPSDFRVNHIPCTTQVSENKQSKGTFRQERTRNRCRDNCLDSPLHSQSTDRTRCSTHKGLTICCHTQLSHRVVSTRFPFLSTILNQPRANPTSDTSSIRLSKLILLSSWRISASFKGDVKEIRLRMVCSHSMLARKDIDIRYIAKRNPAQNLLCPHTIVLCSMHLASLHLHEALSGRTYSSHL